MDDFKNRGFLPAKDPLRAFPPGSAYEILDTLGAELPLRLENTEFRQWAENLSLPTFEQPLTARSLPQLRLYYLRLGFLASGYVNQIGMPAARSLPASLAVPLCHACRLLRRPPMLSYDGYALYNWYRLNPRGGVVLGNLDTIQNFVPLYDEHWFILVHIEIEALAAQSLAAILQLFESGQWRKRDAVDTAVASVTDTLTRQTAVLQRIPEHMSADLYFWAFRPYIRFFEKVRFEGVPAATLNHRGETGAQSSVIPSLVAFFKIRHEANALTAHIADMRNYMPASHRALLEKLDAYPDIRPFATAAVFNRAMDALAEFRSVHFGWARQYIDEHVDDPRGTGGTPFMAWLQQLKEETLAHKL